MGDVDGDGGVADNVQLNLIARYGWLQDSDLSDSDRADQLADLLVDALGVSGSSARRAPASGGSGATVAVVVENVTYLIETVWSSSPVGQEQVEALAQASVTRPGVRLVLLSMSGYDRGALRIQQLPLGLNIVLLDREYIDAILCGLVDAAAILAEAGLRAVINNRSYTSLTDLLMDEVPLPPPARFVGSDRLPAPWPLQVREVPGIQVRHVLSGDAGWSEPLGVTAMDADRMLVTVADGIIEVDLKRGTTDWLLPLSGCRGTPLVQNDGSVLTLCADAVIRWTTGTLTVLGGGFGDSRALFPGPDGEPWVLSGYGPALGVGTGTLALNRIGGALGRQQRHHIHFDADVHGAGWLDGLRFFLASGGSSAVVDLARSTGVRREDWIESPHYRPGHLVVADPQTVLTASPDQGGVHATVYRTDITTRTSTLVAEIASNGVHGLTTAAHGDLLLMGDVRGNDVRVPHPVLIAISSTWSRTEPDADGPTGERADTNVSLDQPRLASFQAATAANRHASTTAATSTKAEAVDAYEQVRLAAGGSRRDYALDARRIAGGGQADVFGATHKPTGTRVAFKRLLTRGLDDVARMRREVEAAQLFGGHPNVVPVLDFSATYDWFVMPLVSDTAESLRSQLRTEHMLRGLITAVCDGLREPHQLGWIHRDLKPDNILHLNGRWAVADWGLGRRPRGQTTDPRRTQLGGRFGTEGFAAPELSIDAHRVSAQADIYSIGQLIGWVLTEQWPRANMPLLPDPGPWRTVVKAATDPDPGRRPATTDDLLALIAGELDDPPTIPANRGEHLHAALRAGDPTALGQLIDLAAQHPTDYDLYLHVLVDLDDEQTRAAVTANPSAAREVVRGVPHLHTGATVTLEYEDVDRLVTWLLLVAHHAEALNEWDLLEDTAESIFYLDHWNRWRVQADIRSWLTSLSGHAASVAGAALRRNPEVVAHFRGLSSDRRVHHRIRQALNSGV